MKHFIVFYIGYKNIKGDKSFGHIVFSTDEAYLNQDETIRDIKTAGNLISAVITNIIELSQEQHDVYVQDRDN
jgi:hypothetical protein